MTGDDIMCDALLRLVPSGVRMFAVGEPRATRGGGSATRRCLSPDGGLPCAAAGLLVSRSALQEHLLSCVGTLKRSGGFGDLLKYGNMKTNNSETGAGTSCRAQS